MPLRNPPPTWPTPPAGWTPPPGWQPDPAWGPPPAGWRLWIEDEPTAGVVGTGTSLNRASTYVGAALAGTFVLLMLVAGAATSGVSGVAMMLGLAVLVVGAAGAALGRIRWARIGSRRAGVAVLTAGLVLTVSGAIAAPAPPAEQMPVAADDRPTPDPHTRTSAPSAAPSTSTTTAPQSPTVTPGLPSTEEVAALVNSAEAQTALAVLGNLEVKGRAPKTGYDRDLFGQAWADVDRNGCDTRNDILARDLTGETFKPGTNNCIVLTGTLAEPYTPKTIDFVRGQDTSTAVQIDHVVALSDAWQKGAQQWDPVKQTAFANDPLNLLAVDGPLNAAKGDGDAATWLPPNKAYRCAYVARQVAVKAKYGAWVTQAEQAAIAGVLATCPNEPLPTDPTVAVAPPAPAPAPAPQPAPAPASAPAPAPPPPAPAPPGEVYYANCAAARAAGAAPVHAGQPGYSSKLDRDGDGVGCES